MSIIYKIHTALFKKIAKAYANGGTAIDMQAKKLRNFADYAGYTFTAADIELLKQWEIESFIVGNIGSIEINNLLKKLGAEYIEAAGKLETGKKDFYKQYVADALEIITRYTPDVIDGKIPPGGWIATNMRDGIATAYHGSRWSKVQEYTDVYYALQKHSKGDNKVREAHAKIDGNIYLLSDPLTKKMVSPLGYNCRCDDEYLTEEETKARTAGKMADNKGILIVPKKRTAKQEAALLKEWGVNPDFARNAVEDKSIYQWVYKKMKELTPAERKEIKQNVKEYMQRRKAVPAKYYLQPKYFNVVVSNKIKFKSNKSYLREILEREIV
jgi:SPP1 gp7 family putative phage head morphogenesis protein